MLRRKPAAQNHERFVTMLALIGFLLAISGLAQERKTPKSAGEWNLVGMALAMQDRWPDAVEAFRQAVRLQPTFVEGQNNLGFALARLGKSAEAIKAYQQAIKVKADFASAYYNVGFTYETLDNWHEADSAFKLALKFSPGWDLAQYHLGFSSLKLGLWKEAQEAFRQYLNPQSPAAPDASRKGEQSDTASEKDALQEGFLVVSVKPEKYIALANLAYAHQQQGRYADAIAAYQQSIQLKPDFADVHYSLGETYVLSKNRAGALQEYEALKNLDSKLAGKLHTLIEKANN